VQTTHTIFRLLTALVLAVFFLPDFFQHGLFMDGTQYAVVARNLAEGHGTFWFPFLSETWNREGLNAFMEQPPLFYFLESLFFRAFGDGFLVEKLFCLFTLLSSAFFIQGIWKMLFRKQPELLAFYWLPVLLWFISPSVSWVFKNNLIETLMSCFVLASVYFSLAGIQNTHALKWLYLILAGFFIFCGSLTKGLPGFFPIVVPVFYALFHNSLSFKKSLLHTVVISVMPLLIYFYLWQFSVSAKESIGFYIEHRLLNRIENDPTVNNRFTILLWLFIDLLPMLFVFVFVFLFFKQKLAGIQREKTTLKTAVFFFCVGLSGVLPLCITKVQREMYYVPAIPFFALAMSFFIAPVILKSAIHWPQALLRKLGLVLAGLFLFTLGYSIFKAGSDARDHEVLQDVRAIGKIIGKSGKLYSPYLVYRRWDLQFYLLRYFNISLSGEVGAQGLSRIYSKNQMPDTLKGYHKLNVGLRTVDLFLRDAAPVKH
jgi:hypothetical protein